MFDVMAAAAIARSGMLNVVRRVLFTSTKTTLSVSAFDFESFYQFGTGIVLISQGTVYVLTPSHVIRNATDNKYTNDSPFWVSTRHDQPKELFDFMMPMRMLDFSPSGEDGLDAALIEMSPIISDLCDYLDWDNDNLICSPGESISGATAVVAGYPEEVNAYEFLDAPDGSVQQVASVKRDRFEGLVFEDAEGTWFVNFLHREGYMYPGLSGSVVVCAVNGQLKYLGIVISIGDGGRRFKIRKFSDIRRRAGQLIKLPWEVLDEAYFLANPTLSTMTHAEFRSSMSGEEKFVQKRTNDYLEQLLRTKDHPRRRHWISDPHEILKVATSLVKYDFVEALKAVARLKAQALQVVGG